MYNKAKKTGVREQLFLIYVTANIRVNCSLTPIVPWNYQAVHIYGKCTVFEDPDRLKEVVDNLTHKYESGFEKPWQPEYKATMLGAIVGVEISINEVQCKYKLSQNRPAIDQEQVIQKLKSVGSNKLAEAMECNEL